MLQTAIDPVAWIRAHLLPDGGVCVSSRKRVPYPEVSGYLVPSLYARGEVDLADRLALWLPTIQCPDGSFTDPDGRETCAFDTGQAVRGLVAALPRHPSLERSIRRACDWLTRTATPEGRLPVPSTESWDMGDRGTIPEGVHLYVLPALVQAGRALDDHRYLEFVERSLAWYVAHENLTDFARPNMLSHFFCYVQEALWDLGRPDLAAQGMRSLARFQQDNGAVPAFHDVAWVCTPGLIQAALVWAKLGDTERAGKALEFLGPYVTDRQGFYGSYGVDADYFASEEISWASKYWLDATHVMEHGAEPLLEPASEFSHNLSPNAWHASIAGDAEAAALADQVRSGDVPRWIEPVLELTRPGDAVLELGSGTGLLSAGLASQGRETTLLDFSQPSLQLSANLFRRMELEADFAAADVTTGLPFADREFDCVWSSGLLEHFEPGQIDHIVAESARISRRLVLSLVPNASSIPYRLGKHRQETEGTWAWGREEPKSSLRGTFERAGLTAIREWTIAPEHALEFLDDETIASAFRSWYATLSPEELTSLGQGYLLVTVGEVANVETPRPRRRLAVVPNDPLDAYVDAGYPDLTGYFNPGGLFDEVYCLSPQETREKQQYGMRVVPTREGELAERIRELDIDVVRAYCLPAGQFACSDKVPGVPVLVSVHDPDPRRCPGALPDADRFLAVSGAIETYLESKGADPHKVTRLPNRVDLDVFRRIDDDVAEARFHAHFPGRYRVLHVGRKSHEKNLDTTLAALARLGPEYTGIFAGRGNAARYLELARELGIQDRCHFLDAVPNRQLAEFYSFADCMCTPSRWEGFGVVFIEALACETVVVTTDRAPMNELIAHEDTGLLVSDPESPEAIADQIRRACENRALADHIRAHARDAARPYSRQAIDAHERSLYERALADRPRAPRAPAIHTRPARQEAGDARFRLHLLTPDRAAEWDRVVVCSPDAWMFHLHAENLLLRDAYDCEDLSFLVEIDGDIAAVCPVQRHRGRKVLLSTLMGSGGPAVRGDLPDADRNRAMAVAHEVLQRYVRQGVAEKVSVLLPQLSESSRAAWATGTNPLLAHGYRDQSSLTSVVDLARSPEVIERGMTKGHRAALRKSLRAGMEIVTARSKADMDTYYRLHVETYTRTGVPPHPRAYFDAIYEHMVRPGHARIFMAKHEGEFVGATNVAYFGDSSLYWTGAYSQKGLELGAARVLQWEAIRTGADQGLRWHETGEVFPDAEPGSKLAGLTTFKAGFGGDRRPWFKGEFS